MMEKNAKIYVAGHRGMVGSAIVRELERQGYTNIITRTHKELDLCRQDAVEEFFAAEKPEYVFLAAAKVGGIMANSEALADFMYDNMTLEMNAIHSAWKNGCKKLEFLGSSCIYPRMAPQPMKENCLLTSELEKTNEAYALAKISGLKYCEFLNRQYGTDYISVMPTNLYGPNDNYHPTHSHVLPALIRRFHEAKVSGAKEVVCWGTGTPLREFLYVDDLAEEVKQMKEANKKKEEKIKELQEFISRFSANASKSKQATSRKRALEKIQLDEIRPSSRKYPYIDFRPSREIGNEVLSVEGITKTIDGVKVLDNVSFIVGHDDKIAFVGGNELAKTTLFKILTGEMEPDSGSYKWGVTTSQSYFPKDNTEIFDTDLLIVDWLTQYSEIKDATYVRGFLGRMLFAGEDGTKKMRVLSGGEKVRVLLSRMMIMATNVLILDEPTDHLDMESITALNNGLIKFPGVVLFASRDHQVVQTTANRIIEFLPDGTFIDKVSTYDEYLENDEMARKRQVYNMSSDDENDN